MAKQVKEPPPVDEDEEEGGEESDGDEQESAPLKGSATLATVDGPDLDLADGEDAPAAAQLGTERYVIAGFFAAGLLGAFVLGKTLEGVWNALANKDWFVQSLALLASVGEDSRKTYSFIVSGIISLIVILRVYRRPDVRAWSDDVAAELGKVVWPKKKEVYNSTFVVILASVMATLYLALLDRLWAFVTNIVYGDGS